MNYPINERIECDLKFIFKDSILFANEIHNTVSKNGRTRKKPFYRKLWFWTFVVVIFMLVKKITELENKFTELNQELCIVKKKISFLDNNKKTANNFCCKESDAVTESPEIQNDSNADLPDENSRVFNFFINKTAKKYHTKFCSGVSRMAESKRETVAVKAETQEQAMKKLEDDGYKLCGVCSKG